MNFFTPYLVDGLVEVGIELFSISWSSTSSNALDYDRIISMFSNSLVMLSFGSLADDIIRY